MNAMLCFGITFLFFISKTSPKEMNIAVVCDFSISHLPKPNFKQQKRAMRHHARPEETGHTCCQFPPTIVQRVPRRSRGMHWCTRRPMRPMRSRSPLVPRRRTSAHAGVVKMFHRHMFGRPALRSPGSAGGELM